jgi:hypothetical protein
LDWDGKVIAHMNRLLKLLSMPKTDRDDEERPYHIINHEGQTAVVSIRTGEVVKPTKGGETIEQIIARLEAETK